METCVFCKIARKEKFEEIYWENKTFIVFPDHDPRTPTHLLIVPKDHFDDFSDMMKRKPELLLEIGEIIEQIMQGENLKGQRYTWGFHGGGKQSVDHVHAQLHVSMDEKAMTM